MANKNNVEDMYSLSPMQEGLLFHYLMDKTSTAYFEQMSYRISGEIDKTLFEQAFNRVIERYDVLRTVFIYKSSQKPRQVLLKQRKAVLHYEDITMLTGDEAARYAADFKRKDKEAGFNLSKDILIRLALLKRGEEDYEIIWSFHHIVMDGWCISIIIKEMMQIYAGLQKGEMSLLPAAVPYRDYIKWLEKQDKQAAIRYWQNYLNGYETQVFIPKTGERKVQKPQLAEHRFTVEQSMTDALTRAARENKTTVNTIFWTLWGILLQKYNNSADAIFGAVVSGRPTSLYGIDTIVGLFINTIPVRVKSEPGTPFDALLKQIRDDSLQSVPREYIPLAEIQAASPLKRDLVNHIIVFENYPIDKEINNLIGNENIGFSVKESSVFDRTHYNLDVEVIQTDRLTVTIYYNSNCYEAAIIGNIGKHLERMMEQVITEPAIPTNRLEIISGHEKAQVLYEFNGLKVDFPGDKTVHQLFEEQAEKIPDHTAVIGMDLGARDMEYVKAQHLTYRALNERSNQLAAFLGSRGIGRDQLTAIMLDRSPALVECIMATWKAGGAYIPFDPQAPVQRLIGILKDSGTQFLLTHSKHTPSSLKDACKNIVTLDTFPFTGNDAVVKESIKNPGIKINTRSLAYVIYTSGSTGRPKGAMVEHIGMMNHLQAEINLLHLTCKSIIAQNAPHTFDISVWQFFAALVTGGRTIVYSNQLVLNPQRFIAQVIADKVTILEVVPSYLSVILNNLELTAVTFESLEYLMVTGEIVKPGLVEQWFARYPFIKMVNAYGPTEASDDITQYIMDKAPQTERVSIGPPLQNLNIYVVDEHMNLCPIGVKGEICVSGVGVGRGYLKDEQRTKQVFMTDPFNKEKDVRLYKTGDFGCWLPNGTIDFFGRKDDQVKIRGYRIELGEIENQLLGYDGLKEAVVIALNKEEATEREDKYLCAYIAPAKEIEMTGLRNHLSKHLPDYMIPPYIVQLEKMPLTPNGKIDRKALPAPGAHERAEADHRHEAPRSLFEEKMAQVWGEVLGVDNISARASISIDDNFFDLGGHSLKAMILLSRIHKQFNKDIPLKEIFNHPTIRELSGYMKRVEENIFASIEPVEKKSYYPVSSAQKRLYVLQQMALDSVAYNVPAVIELEEEPDMERLKETFLELIHRHESLRTSFHIVDNQPVQRIHDKVNFEIEYYDAAGETGNRHHHFIRTFDLSREPLLRAGVAETGQGKYILMVDVHHIVSDGYSQLILSRDFQRLYRGESLPSLRLQYIDFCQWYERRKQTATFKQQEAWWLEQLAGQLPVLNMPTDYPRPPIYNFEGSSVVFEIGTVETPAMKQMARSRGTTLYILLLTLFNVLLSKITGQESIIVGTPIVGRSHVDLGSIIGMFVNTLTLWNYPAAGKTVNAFLKEVNNRSLAAFENQEYPFDELVEKLELERDTSRNPLFDVLFSYHEAETEGEKPTPVPDSGQDPRYRYENRTSKFDLTLYSTVIRDKISCAFQFRTTLFKKETIQRFTRYFKQIVSSVLRSSHREISEIEIISEEEKKWILSDLNDTAARYPGDKTIHRLFEEQAGRTPDRMAIVGQITNDRLGQISYKELYEKTNQLARLLMEKGVKPDTIVGVMVERSIEMIVGIMGILKAGGAYLPIDPGYPEERIQYMLADSGTAILLAVPGIRLNIKVEHFINPAEVPPTSSLASTCRVDPANLVYVIYTSGTTGQPKGTVIRHFSLVNRLKWMQKQFPLEQEDTVLHKTPFTFDVSVWEIFWWGLEGAKLCLLAPGGEKDPAAIVDAVEKNNITVMHFVPAMLNAFLEYIRGSGDIKRLFPLKQVITSGEALLPGLVSLFNDLLARENFTRLANLYGPTEAAIDVSFFDCPAEKGLQEIPIGKPIDNIKLFVVNMHNQLQPIGLTGELCIAGVGLARGYLNRPALTAGKFVHNPFREEPGVGNGYDIMYRTGDLACWLPDGNIRYIGRMDNQVKIRGARVELEEIETQLLAWDGIKEAVVTAGQNKNGDTYLCAYYVSVREVEASELEDYLRKKLPHYMIPGYFISLEKFPLTPSGKVDRKLLKEPEAIALGDYIPPGNETEERLAEIWKPVLGLDKVGIKDNFFRIGGDSIKVIRLIGSINSQLDANLRMADVYHYPTIEKLAGKLSKEESVNSRNEAVENVLMEIEVFEDRVKRSNQTLAIEDVQYIYPMSDIEKGMMFYYAKNLDRPIYHDQVIYQQILKGFDKERMEKALALMIKKHPILRTAYLIEDFAHVVYRYKESFTGISEYQDISSLEKEEQEVLIREYVEAGRNRPFNVQQPPLCRLGVFKTGSENIVMAWEFHHAIIDGWSNASFLTEFNNIYHRLKIEPGFVPQKLKAGYKDFITDQIIEKREPANIDYWKNELSGYKRFEFPGPKGRKKYKSVVIDMGTRVRKKLKSRAEEYGTNLVHLCFAAYIYMLYMFSYDNDITTGVIVHNRPECEDGDKILGCFLNTVPFRVKIPLNKKWSDYIGLVEKNMLRLKRHSGLSFFEIVSAIGEKFEDRNPVFDAVFNFIDFHAFHQLDNREAQLIGDERLQLESYETTNFLFALSLNAFGENFLFHCDYSLEFICEEYARRLYRYFEAVLNKFIYEPESVMSRDEIIPPEEKKRLLFDFNDTAFTYPHDKTIHTLFEEQVIKTPDHTGVVVEDREITYKTLNLKANQLARVLRRKGVGPDTVVGILIERSIDMITAILGVLKAGGAYLPIDTNLPVNRIISMMDDCQVSLLVTGKNMFKKNPFIVLQQNFRSSEVRPQLTAPRPQIPDFNKIPFPDRSLVDYEKYNQSIGQALVKNCMSLQATRGCPYKCFYCHKVWPKTHIFRTAENILEELKLYYDIGVKRFAFIDDIFNLNRKNSERFFQLVIKNNLDIHIFFPNGLRGDILTKDYIDLMIEAGTVNIGLALETASPRLQELIQKNLNLEKFRENIEYIIKKYPHVIVDLFTMHGFPTETREEAMMTLNFIKSLKWVDFPWFWSLKIFPDTDMATLASKSGISKEAMAKSLQLGYHELPETLPWDLSFAKQFRTDYFNNYFLSRERLLHKLPYQIQLLTEDEMVQQYNSILPVEINTFGDLLEFLNVTREELGGECLDEEAMHVPNLNQKLGTLFPAAGKTTDKNALRIFMLDLSFTFSDQTDVFHDVIEPPLGPMYLATYLKQQFGGKVNVKIVKSGIDFDSYEELKRLLNQFKPGLIGVRTLTYYADFFHQTIAAIRQWGFDIPIISGGPYATSSFETILQDRNVDLVVIGEGEITFAEIVRKIMENHGKLPGEEVLKKVPGIAFMPDNAGSKERLSREIFIMDVPGWEAEGENITPINQATDLAYVIFTSGSTGKSKAVGVEHKSAVNMLSSRKEEYKMTPKSSAIQLFSYAFDGFITSFFTPVISGAKVILPTEAEILDMEKIKKIIGDNKITHFISVPGFYKVIIEHLSAAEAASLEMVTLAGDMIGPDVLELSRTRNEHMEIINEFGVTESSVLSTLNRHQEKDDIINIGQPIWNTAIYILNDQGKIQPIGAVGELCIAGVGPGRGYLNRLELTAEKFVPDPFGKEGRMYRSGDLACWLPDGNIEYLGRIDYQVKIRGFRVELGEIEQRLAAHDSIKDAVVTAQHDQEKNKYLTAYYVEEKKGEPELWPSAAEFFVYDDLLYYAMTHDELRNNSYKAAINRLVKDKIVVEVGTGPEAILARFCVDAGVKKVYAIEMLADSYKKAQEKIKTLGLEDKIILIHGDATKVEIPGKADVCLSEIVGAIGGCEGAVPILNSARRFLKKNGAVIPERAVTKIAAVYLPASIEENPGFTEIPGKYVEKIFRQVGHTFDLRLCIKNFPKSNIISTEDIFEDLDFTGIVAEESSHQMNFTIKKDAVLDGFLIWLTLHTIEAEVIDILENPHCWLPVYVPVFYPGIDVSEGDLVKAECTRTLCENNINPDYKIKGILIRKNRENIEFAYRLPHFDRSYKRTPFYQKLFKDDSINYLKDTYKEPVSMSRLREYLSKELPGYMVPAYFVSLDRIPLTPTGKVNRKALPDPGVKPGEVSKYIAPRNKIEIKLTEIWSDVLGIQKDSIGIDTGFFELGGHSLKATRMNAMIHKELGVKFPMDIIFSTDTIRGLAKFLEGEVQAKYTAVQPVEKKEYYAQSFAQKRLYILQQLEPRGIAYNLAEVLALPGKTDIKELEAVFQQLINRHESLRTSFHSVGGEPVQRIHDTVELKIEYYDSGDEKDRSRIVKDFIRAFDLSRPPLFRVGLIHHPPQYILLVDMHHIISDGVSHQILAGDFMRLYPGKGEPLPPLKLQYKDYAEWQTGSGQREAVKNQEEFWLKEFEAEIPVLHLPIDYPRPGFQSFEGDSLDFDLDEDASAALDRLALSEGTTLFMVLFAFYNVLLAKLSGQEEIVIGIPAAGRRHADLQQIMGMFVNSLPLKNYPKGEKTFKEFLIDLKERSLKAFENQEYPFEDLLEKVKVNRDTSRSPLFDVMFTWQIPEDLPADGIVNRGGEAVQNQFDIRSENQTAKFDLTLHAAKIGKRLHFTFEYCTTIFKRETLERFANYFKEIISDLIVDQRKKLLDIQFIPEEEKNRLLFEFNDTQAPYPGHSTVDRLFEDQVERTPDHIALIYMEHTLTYHQLNETSDLLAHVLSDKGVGPDIVVAIMAERSIEMIIGIMGTLKAGGAYLPIDPGYPAQRVNYMLGDSGAELLVTKERGKIRGIESKKNIEILLLDFSTLLSYTPSTPLPIYPSRSSSLAYVIYTSGSTGNPKGVMINHREVVNYIWWAARQYVGNEAVNFPLYTSLSFDLTVTSVFTPLITGNAIVVYEEEDTQFLMEDIITDVSHNIGVVKLTPSHLKLIRESKTRGHCPVKRFILGGEDLDARLAREVYANFNERVEIYNEYGPTETVVGCMIYQFDPASFIGSSVPIGKPISNARIYILDRGGKPVPMGVVGELYVGGAGVGRGYLNQPELTEETFLTDPFKPGERCYRTGDLAKFLDNGEIEYKGRIDTQLKIRGYRIEAGEIERLLLKHEDIIEAAVTVKEITRTLPGGETREKSLCAYVVSGREFGIMELREYLSGSLPGYMIPTYVVSIDRLPLTPSGKIDIKALPEPRERAGGNYEAPVNQIQEILVEQWKEVMRVEGLGINDNFFEMGGDSIKLLQISSRLMKHRLKLEMKDIYLNPTIKQLAPHIKKLSLDIPQGAVEGEVELTPIQYWFFRHYRADRHHYNQSLVIYRPGGFDEGILVKVFTKIMQHHDALRIKYQINESNVIQVNQGANEIFFDLKIFNWRDREWKEREIEIESSRLQEEIDLEKSQLVKLGLFKTRNGDYLSIAIHHLIIDGVSWRILFEDFALLYKQVENNEKEELPLKTTSFKEWAKKLNTYSNSKELIEQLSYWKKIEKTQLFLLPKTGTVKSRKLVNSKKVSFQLTGDETHLLLEEVNRFYNTQIDEILLTALGLALKEWSGSETFVVHLEGHGREEILKDVDISRTIGWFTSLYPVVLDTKYSEDIPSAIKNTKEMLRGIPDKGIGYGILKYLTAEDNKQDLQFHLKPEISFNYLGQFGENIDTEVFQLTNISPGNPVSLELGKVYSLDILAVIVEGQLNVIISYDAGEYDDKIMLALVETLQMTLGQIIHHCVDQEKAGLTVGDLTYNKLSIEQLNRLTRQYPVEDIWPLSPMQEGLYFIALTENTSYAYFEQMAFRLHGDLNIGYVEKSLNELIKRYDILRAAFVREKYDHPLQIILRERKIDFYYKDIRNLGDSEEKTSFINQFKELDRERSFDLSNDVLIRAAILRFGDADYEFIWSFHHILIDGWCIGILISDFFGIYNSYLEGKAYRLPVVKQFREYLQWLQELDREASKKYWGKYLDKYEKPAVIPGININTPKYDKSKIILAKFKIEKEKTKALNLLAGRNQVTLNTIIQAVWGIILGKYNNKQDAVFGIVVSGRPAQLEGVESMVGLFINTIPVRIRFKEDTTISDLLRNVQEDALEMNAHQYLPLAEIQSLSSLKHNLIHHALVFENYPVDKYIQRGIKGVNLEVSDINTFELVNFDCLLVVSPGEQLSITFGYYSNDYNGDYKDKIPLHIKEVIDQMIEDDNTKIKDIKISQELLFAESSILEEDTNDFRI